MPSFPGIAHVSLTVTDVDTSTRWYTALLGSEPRRTMTDGPFVRRVFAVPGGQAISIVQHDGAPPADTFDPRRPGLDHLSFEVGAEAQLHAWERRLAELEVEHSTVQRADYGSVLSFKDPDGNALEFIASS
ncbi:VOC family protein [Blastococcus saxobsidens]|uniref:Glyoxalase/bleomycin resistance protein/dioxygenase n=1 Tax=Blastococcus saxobsidens (strain DD2) TaxID=1146883 RepID=H6RR48_BLASD|nr:VOC family protein [Blastococcus saxobsidens]CCG04128.1 Glyoxalase/bleomycin resistance protein/dioxygenase [Blastococcus saxobsidens DD2]